MANAPTLLRGYLDLTRTMKRTHLVRRIVERINLAVHEWLSCDYCLVAHTRAARQPPHARTCLSSPATVSSAWTEMTLAHQQERRHVSGSGFAARRTVEKWTQKWTRPSARPPGKQ
jgi:hypothetical protein